MIMLLSFIRRKCFSGHVSPVFHTGRDCMGCAKTGSGKTAAFVLPVLQKLSEDPYGVFCLVLTPTRFIFLLYDDLYSHI